MEGPWIEMAERSGKKKRGAPQRDPGAKPASPRSGARLAIIRFVLIVGAGMVLFNLLFYVRLSEDTFFGSYLALNARLSAAFINLFV